MTTKTRNEWRTELKVKIEVEADTEDSLKKLIEHIAREITLGDAYKSHEIEQGLTVDEGWVAIRSGSLNGRYKWERTGP